MEGNPFSSSDNPELYVGTNQFFLSEKVSLTSLFISFCLFAYMLSINMRGLYTNVDESNAASAVSWALSGFVGSLVFWLFSIVSGMVGIALHPRRISYLVVLLPIVAMGLLIAWVLYCSPMFQRLKF